MKINKVTFYNYKAFYSATEDEKYEIKIPDEKHLLVYGENGSGKSSIFEGLKDLFQSSINTQLEFNQNIFSVGTIPAKPEPFISINFQGDPETYTFSTEDYQTNTKGFDFIKKSNTAKSFLSYKELLKTHFIKDDEELNLFELMVGENGLIADVKNPSGVAKNHSDDTLGNLWKTIKNKAESRRNSWSYKSLSDYPIIQDFNVGLDAYLDLISATANNLLREFDPNFVFEKFEYTELQHNDVKDIPERLTSYKIIPKLKFYNKEVDNYSFFLNEARLTALALSIYFASLIGLPSPPYKILFLDDVFIGLDTNNRIPLLNILKKNFLASYQVIITTYDKSWFELVREQLGKDNWEAVEIYTKENNNKFQPVIIQPSLDYYDSAMKYFDAKDYPACGNYQRKAFEKLIRDFLPSNMTLKCNEDGTVGRIDKLETLFDQFKKYIEQCSLDFSPFTDFTLYKRVVLNPLSHDDIKSPYFKSELEKTFQILDALRALKRIEIIKAGESLFITKNNSQGVEHKFSLESKDNFSVIKQDATRVYSKCAFVTKNKWINDIREDFPSEITNLELVYKNICRFLKVPPSADFSSEFYTKENKYLSNF